ncbi:MAG: AlpA family phage regulatory protein [Actinobacteria bacterium]|nr:AlpA family phage regulatory protein [Actinomycetota bacterium]
MERCADSLRWLKIQTGRKVFKCHVKRPEFEEQLLGSFLPFSASTLWRTVRAGKFPAPVKLGPAITAWREKDVVDWLNQQLEGGQS